MGEEPLGKEPPLMKIHREFYEKLPSIINRDTMRPSTEPAHKWELGHWARTRWILHDLRLEEAHDLRCDWFREDVSWQSGLDQLSLAAVLAKRDIFRALHHNEIDETVQKALGEKTGMKKLLSDTFEWVAMETEANKNYSPYEEMKILPYEIDYVLEEEEATIPQEDQPVPLFVRVISDRIMSASRKMYNDMKELEEIEKRIREEDEKKAAEKAQAESAAAAEAAAAAESDKQYEEAAVGVIAPPEEGEGAGAAAGAEGQEQEEDVISEAEQSNDQNEDERTEEQGNDDVAPPDRVNWDEFSKQRKEDNN